MAKRRTGLGRGLDELIGNLNQPTEAAPKTDNEVRLDQLEPNPFQPRKNFNEEALNSLAKSIRSQGLIQPILVRHKPGSPGKYQIIAGERRFRAAKLAGFTTVPIVIREVDDSGALTLALLENLQREDLGPIEMARGLQQLRDEFSLTQRELAEALGVSREKVANSLRLLRLPAEVLQFLNDGNLSEGQARLLLSIDDPARIHAYANLAVEKDLTVRELAALIKEGELTTAALVDSGGEETATSGDNANREVTVKDSPADSGSHTADLRLFSEDLQRHLGTQVAIKPTSTERGRIVIEYYSSDELNGLYHRLLGRSRD